MHEHVNLRMSLICCKVTDNPYNQFNTFLTYKTRFTGISNSINIYCNKVDFVLCETLAVKELSIPRWKTSKNAPQRDWKNW